MCACLVSNVYTSWHTWLRFFNSFSPFFATVKAERPLHLGQTSSNFGHMSAFVLEAKPCMNASGEAAKGLVMNRVEMQSPQICQPPLLQKIRNCND